MSKSSTQTLKETSKDSQWHPKLLHFFAGIFVVNLILVPIIGAKIIDFGLFSVSASILTFPIVCIVGDIVTEIYGFNRARQLIWVGFVASLMMLFFTQLTIFLPSSDVYKDQEALKTILGLSPRIAVASFSAYLFCEFTNSFVMSRMKLMQNAKFFAARAVASTLVAQLVDSIIFFTLAFWGTMPPAKVVALVISGWLLKTSYEAIALPLTVPVMRHAKKLEGVEHFDRQELHII